MNPCPRSALTLAMAAAAVLAATPATAQTASSVQLYGIVDIGVEFNDSGVPDGKRFTFALHPTAVLPPPTTALLSRKKQPLSQGVCDISSTHS